ncbi:hypothetical protein ACMD2_20098, partial [Ananas comosus]
ESPLARPALPQRHRSLHQWDDLFGSPFPANPVKEPHVSYPKKRKDSLSVRDNDQFILRKRRKKWSSLEEETLRKSVERRPIINDCCATQDGTLKGYDRVLNLIILLKPMDLFYWNLHSLRMSLREL